MILLFTIFSAIFLALSLGISLLSSKIISCIKPVRIKLEIHYNYKLLLFVNSMTNLPISRDQAIEWLKSMPQLESDFNHYLESEAIMRALAAKLNEDQDYWSMLGLLHDVDWALTKGNVSQHCIKVVEILKDKGFDDKFIQIVQSHGYGFNLIPSLKDKQRTKKIEFALASSETLTGLIYAYALMKQGQISDMEVAGLKKKFKDKRFAANCNREIIKECEKIPLSLDEFFQIAIDAMKSIKDQIRLT